MSHLHHSMVDHDAIRRELREQRKAKQRDPLVVEKAPRVWVAYIWDAKIRKWILGGFVRMQRVTVRRVRRWRKKMKLAADTLVRWVELFTAAGGINPSDVKTTRTRDAFVRRESLRPDSVPSDIVVLPPRFRRMRTV